MVRDDDDAAAVAATVASGGDALAATAVSGDSLADTLAAGLRAAEVAPTASDRERYQLGDRIGAGGMGEVLSAADRRIGRDVAVKRTRTAPPPELAARFLREAQIQGRLDHPAIVPVYDLGVDDAGRPYFVMKRLAGVSLHEVLTGVLDERWSRRKLLAAFVEVCLAVEFAHTRGIVHRDLKPANIMLGDFGEVYVLDWGVARVLRDPGDERGADIVSLDGGTRAGAVLGTPGFMAPEQAHGEATTPASDIYSLGATLFHVLAGEEFARGLLDASEVDRVPSHRGVDVPPELDAICARALAPAPADRFASARELGDAVQRYLDGDRDLARRRELAAEHLGQARRALAAGDVDGRAAAMRAAGQALALDPTSRDAAAVVTRLMLEPPARPPPEVARALRVTDEDAIRRSARRALWSFAALAALMPFALWQQGGDRPVPAILFIALAMINAGHAARISMGRTAVTARRLTFGFCGNVMLVGMISYATGPFLLVPTVAMAVVVSFAGLPLARPPWVLGSVAALAVLVPWLLEATGAISGNTRFVDGGLVIHARGFAMSPTAMTIILVSSSVAVLVAGAYAAHGPAVVGRQARDRLAVQAWQLQQLVPEAAPPPTDRDTNEA